MCAIEFAGLGAVLHGRTFGHKGSVEWVRSARFDARSVRFYEKIVTRLAHPLRFADRTIAVFMDMRIDWSFASD